MSYSLESLLDEAKDIATKQGEAVMYTLNSTNELILDSDVKELINYLSDNKTQCFTYTHS